MPISKETAQLKKFYKQTFELKSKGISQYRHTLLVNPEDMNVSEPARTNVQQTLGGAYVTDFGAGIHQVSLSGTTGYKLRSNAEGKMTDGYQEAKDIRRKLYRNFVESGDANLEMYWYNWEDEEYYQIIPTNFRISRNKNEPLLYRYELQFQAIRRLDSSTLTKPVAVDQATADPNTQSMSSNMASGASALAEALAKLLTAPGYNPGESEF